MGSIRAAVVVVTFVCMGCAVSEEPEGYSPPTARPDAAAAESAPRPPSGDDEGPVSEPDTAVEPEDTEPPAFPGAEDAEPPPAATCESCLMACDDVCAKTPSSCKACDDACFAGPCAGGGPDSGPDPCGCAEDCEDYCWYSYDPLACESACMKACTADCGS